MATLLNVVNVVVAVYVVLAAFALFQGRFSRIFQFARWTILPVLVSGLLVGACSAVVGPPSRPDDVFSAEASAQFSRSLTWMNVLSGSLSLELCWFYLIMRPEVDFSQTSSWAPRALHYVDQGVFTMMALLIGGVTLANLFALM